MKTNEALELAKYYASWINHAPEKKSANTVKAYEIAIRLYMLFLEQEKGVSQTSFCTSSDLSSEIINEWLTWLKTTRKCSAASCNERLASLRVFLKYLGKCNPKYKYLYIGAKEVERMKGPQRIVTGMSEDAVEALLREPDVKTGTGYRDLMFMDMLYATAARVSEVLSIKIGDLRFRGNKSQVIIRGKGDKFRTCFFSEIMTKNLRKYITKFHGPCPNSENILFYSRVKGRKGEISPEAMNKRLKIYAERAHEKCDEVPLGLHAHQFRHAKATHLLQEGVNVVQLSALLGHAQLSTTMKYLDITLDMKTEAIMKMEDEKLKNLPKKWKEDDGKLTSLFK